MVAEDYRSPQPQCQAGHRYSLVAEERLARENGNDVADNPQPKQHENVNRRVGIEPEKVLVKQHLPPHLG